MASRKRRFQLGTRVERARWFSRDVAVGTNGHLSLALSPRGGEGIEARVTRFSVWWRETASDFLPLFRLRRRGAGRGGSFNCIVAALRNQRWNIPSQKW